MGIRSFFKKAFSDMKESAKTQHKVDKANFAAARAQWEEAKAMGRPETMKMLRQEQKEAQIREANKRIAAAEKRIDEIMNP